MPQTDTIKEYAPDSYYHVYTRGVNKQAVFIDTADYQRFESLFDRYLSGEVHLSPSGASYPDYAARIELVSYCLMSNHIHLLLRQNAEPDALRRFMSSLMTSYSKYFNKRHNRVGALFESRYKAKRITDDAYLMHITRYIHMNPRRWATYTHSSLKFVFSQDRPVWLRCEEIIEEEFKNKAAYVQFLEEYQGNKDALEQIKHELVDI